MEPLQIYTIVNDVGAQALGTKALTVVNEQGLISLGRTVLDSQTYVDNFVNVLTERIGKTIMSYRAYKSKFSGLVKDKMEFGAIVQKVKVSMPVAEEDESYDLTDGTSVDHYKISKPSVHQKLFVTNTPYQFKITIQEAHLKEAFTSVGAMGSFISAIYGEVQNAIELSLENLGRNCLTNMMAEARASQTYNLRTMYNATVETAEQIDSPVKAMQSEKFLRYAIQQIKNVMDDMETMNKLFNDGTETRHTPKEMQKLFVLSRFQNALETQVEYAAFNDQYLRLSGYEKVPFWQAHQSGSAIDVARASDNSEVTISNIVACVFDKDALGSVNEELITRRTPLNAGGLYYNVYHHLKQLWFNDTSEQFVMFTLN